MGTIKTTIHCYCFDTRNASESAEYAALCAKLQAWPHRMHAIGDFYYPGLDGKTIELDTSCLFENQWNTAPLEGYDKGIRVFDWAENVEQYQKHIRRGHWLEQTPEMVAIRADTIKCRYCGAYEPKSSGLAFCPHCLDSEYLKQEDLFLTRMKAVSDTSECEPLTEAEQARLVPLFVQAQIAKQRERIIEKRERIIEKASEAIDNATSERDGLLWLMDHGVSIDNAIYYGHTMRFCIGWRKPLSDLEKAELMRVLQDFPFSFDLR